MKSTPENHGDHSTLPHLVYLAMQAEGKCLTAFALFTVQVPTPSTDFEAKMVSTDDNEIHRQ